MRKKVNLLKLDKEIMKHIHNGNCFFKKTEDKGTHEANAFRHEGWSKNNIRMRSKPGPHKEWDSGGHF